MATFTFIDCTELDTRLEIRIKPTGWHSLQKKMNTKMTRDWIHFMVCLENGYALWFSLQILDALFEKLDMPDVLQV